MRHERACFDDGDRVVVGMDEVGRGAWAGPVTVGAVAVNADLGRILKVRDSKVLTVEEREALYPRITAWALCWGVGHATHVECDELGMTAALRLAGERALAILRVDPDRVILDGNHDYLGLGERCRTVIDGDAHCLSVAAASVVAKVTRDRMMAAEADHYPGFEFDSNRGYPSPRHRYALAGYGPTAIHRRSWVFMDNLPWAGKPTIQANLFASR
jgi:ribonuclease HII